MYSVYTLNMQLHIHPEMFSPIFLETQGPAQSTFHFSIFAIHHPMNSVENQQGKYQADWLEDWGLSGKKKTVGKLRLNVTGASLPGL